jgi:hypothetical protein
MGVSVSISLIFAVKKDAPIGASKQAMKTLHHEKFLRARELYIEQVSKLDGIFDDVYSSGDLEEIKNFNDDIDRDIEKLLNQGYYILEIGKLLYDSHDPDYYGDPNYESDPLYVYLKKRYHGDHYTGRDKWGVNVILLKYMLVAP